MKYHYPRGKLAIHPNTAHSSMTPAQAVRFAWCYGLRVSKRAVRRRLARVRTPGICQKPFGWDL